MPQTLLALFALACATYYTHTRQRAIVDDQYRLIVNEIELIAASVAVDRLELISAQKFDDKTVGGTILTSSSQLTTVAKLGVSGETGGNNDVDDYHNASYTVTRIAGGQTLRFEVETSVYYGKESDPEAVSTSPTKVKTVTATVTSLDVDVPGVVTLMRSYACGASCNW